MISGGRELVDVSEGDEEVNDCEGGDAGMCAGGGVVV